MNQTVRFTSRAGNDFYRTVTKRVNHYFKQNKIDKQGGSKMIVKTIFFLGGVVVLYSLIMSNQFTAWQLLPLAVLLGMFKAFVGFNVSHDAIHGSYSKNKTFNRLLALFSFNLLGGNAYMWDITHNQVHHTYTNIPGHDEDIEVAPGILRLSPEEKRKGFMRYQQYYAFLLYGLSYFSWVFRKDYKKFFAKKIGAKDNSQHPRQEYVKLFLFKGLYYVLFIVLPLLVLDITWWQFIIGFLAMQFSAGIVLGLVFQLAHVVEGLDFPYPNEEGNIEEAWAIHQMQTTANFARKNRLINWFVGGLNFQIEHHLFPHISHIHYPKVSAIVKKTAMEFGVPYHEYETMPAAIGSHYRMLKQFGRA